MVYLSPHFTLEEMTFSQTAVRKGIDNSLDPVRDRELYANLLHTCNQMEIVRQIIGAPITVLSCYRNEKVNKLVGGSTTSDHMKALAVDTRNSKYNIHDTIDVLRHSNLQFDQLIDEFGEWTHIGFGNRHRREVLIARKVVMSNGTRTIYTQG